MKKYIIKQEDEADCGSACLLSIIKYYNGYVPLEIIKSDTLTTKEGTTFYNLKMAAIKYGFEVNGIKTRNINKLVLPFIAQEKINELFHFVVVLNIAEKITLMDPSYGIKILTIEEFNNIFTGNCLCLNPINNIVKYEKSNPFMKLLFSYVKDNINKIIQIILLSVLIVLSSLLLTYGIKLILTNKSLSLIYIFFIMVVFSLLLNYIKNNIIAHLNQKININLINDYLKQIYYLSFKDLQLKKGGEITTRINDLNNIRSLFTKEIANCIINILFIIGSIIILFSLNINISFTLLLFTLIYVLIAIKISKKLYYLYLSNIDSDTLLMDNVIENINNIGTIKNINKENYFLEKIKKLVKVNYHNYFILENKLNDNDLVNNIYNQFSLIIILFLGIVVHLSSSNILVYILFYNYFSDSIKYFMDLIPSLIYFKGIFNKISGLYYLKSESSSDGLKFINGDINIINLSYKININQIFNNHNFNIRKGEKVLLIGSNGSGKSTLLNIIIGNINNYQGKIMINKVNINKINYLDLRKHISYVSQEDSLFSDTILSNIILDNEFNQKRLDLINKIVDLDSIIKKKVNGINSIVNNNFSGGEKQRILLARALYKDFNILLLDEALSEVSPYLRLRIINNINHYYNDKTIIFVSHNYEKYPFDKVINLTVRKEEYVNG